MNARILFIDMILLMTVFVYDSLGVGPQILCSPCDAFDYDYCTLSWRCMGPIADCSKCFGCDTSNPGNPQLVAKCKTSDCKYCDYGSGQCGEKCAGCPSGCDPNLCLTCDGNGSCIVCGGDANKACCNGQCYDVRTHQCCQDTSTPYICDLNSTCCNGECCPNATKCCVNGECKDPICDNCHCYDRTFNECFHWATDPNGAPCYTTGCIHNEMSTATCDFHDNAPSCSKCTAQVQATGTACWQTVYAGPCSGGQVNWQSFVTFYTGCPTCTAWDPGGDACLTDSCEGVQVGFPMEHGALWNCTGTCP